MRVSSTDRFRTKQCGCYRLIFFTPLSLFCFLLSWQPCGETCFPVLSQSLQPKRTTLTRLQTLPTLHLKRVLLRFFFFCWVSYLSFFFFSEVFACPSRASRESEKLDLSVFRNRLCKHLLQSHPFSSLAAFFFRFTDPVKLTHFALPLRRPVVLRFVFF